MNKPSLSDWNHFLQLCQACSSTKELEELFDLFLTPEEKENLTARFLIIKSLCEEKLTQREIASQCHVSIAQITRGSNALKRASSFVKKLLASTFRA